MYGVTHSFTISQKLGSRPIHFRMAACFTVQKRGVNMSDLFWLTDAQMACLEPFFPKPHGKPRVDDRRVLKLKDWRRVATRYDRCPKVFLSAIALAALVIYWLCVLTLASMFRVSEIYCESPSRPNPSFIAPNR